MQLSLLTPKRSLNKAYSKEKLSRADIEIFKQELTSLLDKTDVSYSEDTLKDFVADFLKAVYFKNNYFVSINKERKDLAVHTGKSIKEPVGIIAEVKRLHTAEMMTAEKPNVKAFHELVLYYLHERATLGNPEIKYLAATNVHHWFLFDANEFDKKIFGNPRIKKLYDIYKGDKKDNGWFYTELKTLLAAEADTLTCTYLDLTSLEAVLRNASTADDKALIATYKILSPEHLLKKPFVNDSNSLDKGFYTELLHLIGLEEIKDGSKKLIQRKGAAARSEASVLENTIIKLSDKEALYHLPNRQQWGDDTEAQLQAVALELCITWVNRILFLKLLEAQLFGYHGSNRDYLFLNGSLIFDYDELNNLFFQVLAEKEDRRRPHLQQKFSTVPYLNSSLFERTALERATLDISALDNRQTLPLHKDTVLKEATGKRRSGALPTLDYLFQFLDAYDFTSEGKAEIQEENKTLINASVLGLIFEKINGYKDGSFFTPGFITMYMCAETLRRAVVQKFNEAKGWNVKSYEELYDKIDDRAEANAIINSFTICDPAVGSGHFLVSALNELIAIKAGLKILQDRNGKRLKEYSIEVVNDELVVTDDDGEPVDYKPGHPESQRIQEALFHEKERLIEGCLFGVDINANSVKICRLRLWIELLKHAYYTKGSNYKSLETLPNIDINIKQGNSLISRYALDADVAPALKQSKWTIDTYRSAVHSYKEAGTKEEKRELEGLIATIKTDFRKDVSPNDPVRKKLSAKRGELAKLTQTKELFDEGAKPKKAALKVVEKLSADIEKLEAELKDAENNKIYTDAFEWRFEFPEVLDNEGKFVGFDVVIGNPPYKMIQPHNTSEIELNSFKQQYPFADFKIDLFHLFFQLGNFISKQNGGLSFIAPSTLLYNFYTDRLRSWISENNCINKIVVTKEKVFDDADVHTAIYFFTKSHIANKNVQLTTALEDVLQDKATYKVIAQKEMNETPGNVWNLLVNEKNIGLIKILASNKKLADVAKINRGLITGDREKYFSKQKLSDNHVPILTGSDIFKYYHLNPSEFVLFERPKSAGGCWDKEVHFSPQKICVRQIGFEPTATLIAEPFAVTGNIFTVIAKDVNDSKFLLSILNSKAIKYYWQIMFNDFKSSFPQVTIFSLSQIPIPDIIENSKLQLVGSVDQILAIKKQNSSADTTDLEKQIDTLVYQLYNLTPDEIAIVEKGA